MNQIVIGKTQGRISHWTAWEDKEEYIKNLSRRLLFDLSKLNQVHWVVWPCVFLQMSIKWYKVLKSRRSLEIRMFPWRFTFKTIKVTSNNRQRKGKEKILNTIEKTLSTKFNSKLFKVANVLTILPDKYFFHWLTSKQEISQNKSATPPCSPTTRVQKLGSRHLTHNFAITPGFEASVSCKKINSVWELRAKSKINCCLLSAPKLRTFKVDKLRLNYTVKEKEDSGKNKN